MAKEYVLVSQGIEIYRTTDKDKVEKIMGKSNQKWNEYCQECYNELEVTADNEVFMYEK